MYHLCFSEFILLLHKGFKYQSKYHIFTQVIKSEQEIKIKQKRQTGQILSIF